MLHLHRHIRVSNDMILAYSHTIFANAYHECMMCNCVYSTGHEKAQKQFERLSKSSAILTMLAGIWQGIYRYNFQHLWYEPSGLRFKSSIVGSAISVVTCWATNRGVVIGYYATKVIELKLSSLVHPIS